MRAHILGTGRSLPSRVVTNAEIASRVDTTDAWIRDKLGVIERRFAADDEQTSDLAAAASRRALVRAQVEVRDVDMIIVALGHGDVISPATACYVQEKLGAFGAVAFDVRAACAGFVVGLDIARAMVESGARHNVLVVGAGIISRTELNWRDPATTALFSDGAGAALVGRARGPDAGFLASAMGTDGRAKDAVGVYGGGSIAPLSAELLARGDHTIHMDGRKVLRGALRHLPTVVREAVTRAGLTLSDVRLLITHQGSGRLVEAVARELGFAPERTHSTIERFGNTLAASAAITLDEALEQGKAAAGDLVVVAAIGGGMTYGAHVLRM